MGSCKDDNDNVVVVMVESLVILSRCCTNRALGTDSSHTERERSETERSVGYKVVDTVRACP